MLGQVYPRRISRLITFCGTVAAILAALCIVFGFLWRNDHNNHVTRKAIILSIWVIVVPLWFSIEYFFLYKTKGLDGDKSFDHFKHGQDVATKAWLAVVTVLTALYFGNQIPFSTSPDTKQVILECKQCPCQETHH